MKKLLSILLALSMVLSLTAAFATVSFADGESGATTTLNTKDFFDDEWNATTEGFSLNIYDANRDLTAFLNTNDNIKWSSTALKWFINNGHKGYAVAGRQYHVVADGDSWKIEEGGNANNTYSINGHGYTAGVLSKSSVAGEQIIAGGYHGYDDTAAGVPANKYPLDFDISLNGGKEISGLRIYRTKNGTTTTVDAEGNKTFTVQSGQENHGNYMTKYDVYVKFDGSEDYVCLVEDGTNSKNENFDINFGCNLKVTDVRIKVKEVRNKWSGFNSYITVGGITVLKSDSGNATYNTLAEFAVKDIDTRVVGGLENLKSIEAAESYDKNAAESYREAYDRASVKEVATDFGAALLTYYDNSTKVQVTDRASTVLTDGKISADRQTRTGSYWSVANFSVYPNENKYLTITLPVNGTTDEFTGIRFYSRKADNCNKSDHTGNSCVNDKWNCQVDNSAQTVKVTLIGEDGETSVTSGVLTAVKGEKGVYVAAEDTTSNAYSDADKKHMENIDYRYVDIALSYDNKMVRVKNVKKIIIEVQSLFSSNHWGSEEVRLINNSDVYAEVQTVSDVAKDVKDNAVDERVIGSLENKKTLEAAEAIDTTYYAEQRASYNAAVVKELDAKIGNVTADYYFDNGKTSREVKNEACAALTNGIISPDNMIENEGSSYYCGKDWAVHTADGKYLTLTIPVNSSEEFTGIRFYNRKSHALNHYLLANAAKYAEVTLYDNKGNYVTSGTLTSVPGNEHGIINSDKTLKVTAGSNGEKYNVASYAGNYSNDIRYVDLKLNFNDENVRVSDASKIVIVIKELYSGNQHWGAEEVRLINDSSIAEDATMTVSEIGKGSVVLSNITAQSGVYENGKGIIRFITEFTKIAEGAEIESFGTYAIKSDKYTEGTVPTTGDNVGVYDGTTNKPATGNNFSVDINNIEEAYFNVPVTAISFVKVKGCDNLIVTGIINDVKVNTENKLRTEN